MASFLLNLGKIWEKEERVATECKTGGALGTACLADMRNEEERASNAALVHNRNSNGGTDSNECERVLRERGRV